MRREQDQGEAQRQLAAENARLKRQLADQAEELAIIRIGGRLAAAKVVLEVAGGVQPPTSLTGEAQPVSVESVYYSQ